MNMTDPTTGDVKQAGWILWPIFGASNQMLAALTLLVMTLYFWQRKKQVIALILPMIFIMLVTLSTLLMKLQSFYGNNPLLFILNLLLTGLILWMIAEGLLVVRRIQKSGGEIRESGL
jgi:carbon starvation protein